MCVTFTRPVGEKISVQLIDVTFTSRAEKRDQNIECANTSLWISGTNVKSAEHRQTVKRVCFSGMCLCLNEDGDHSLDNTDLRRQNQTVVKGEI